MSRKKAWIEKILSFFAFVVLWFGLFHFSGILDSGFHLTDDHEVILFNDLLKKQSVFSLVGEQVEIDMATRFRPAYYVHRVLITSLIGTSSKLWAVYFCGLAVVCSFLLFRSLLHLGFSIFPAFLFPLFALWGEQTAVWWRLGTAETLGIVFTSFSIYCLAKSVSSQRKWWDTLFLVFAILAALSKESFILMIPALLFWRIWTDASNDWSVKIKVNILNIIILGFTFCIEIYLISTQTQAEESIFNAGAAEDSNFRNTIMLYMITKLLTFNKLNLLFLVFFGLVLFSLADDIKHSRLKIVSLLKEISPALLLSLLVIVPQFVLYLRTDLYERYLIPTTLGLAFFAVFLIQLVLKQDFIKQYLKITFCVVGFLGLYFPLGKAYFKGSDFATEGVQTNAFLRFVKTVTNEQSGILLVAEPVQHHEWIHAFYRFMQSSAFHRKNIYLQLYTVPNPNVPQEFAEAHKQKVATAFQSQLFDFERDREKITCIAFFPSKETEKMFGQREEWLKEMKFEKHHFGNFLIYSK